MILNYFLNELDKILKDGTKNTKRFEGKITILGIDFRQTLIDQVFGIYLTL